MRYLFIFFLGAACGVGVLYYIQSDNRPSRVAAGVSEKVKESAADARDALADKLDNWHLTQDDIKRDLAKGSQIVRSKTETIGERIADARIVAVINAKLVLDRDLSVTAINVDCRDGDVVLRGSVDGAALIGRAMALTLDTNGVRTVTSRLTVTTAR